MLLEAFASGSISICRNKAAKMGFALNKEGSRYSKAGAYTGRGEDYMDKSNQHTYCFENQFLIVERHFTGKKSIEEIVRQYMSEQMEKMSGPEESDNVQYNCSCQKAVVASAKEDGK